MHQSLQMLHCPQCGSLYTDSEVGVLQESDMAILATITCAKCHYQSVVTLSLGNSSAASSLSSDLKPAEMSKFLNMEPLSSDDLLDIHQFLKKAKGNFNQDFKATAVASPAKKPKRTE